MVALHDLERIAEGREAEVFAWDEGHVLRLFRGPRTSERLNQEAAAMTAVREALPLVPAVGGTVEVAGRPGLILDRVDGIDLLSQISRRPWTAWRNGAMTGRVQAQVHAVPAPAVLPELKDWIARRITASAAVPDAVADRALVALAELPDGDQLCHGDLHPGNILLTRAGPSVIDWPNATRGDPTADLARTLVLLRSSTLPPETPLTLRLGHRAIRRVILRALAQGYQRIRPVDQPLLDRWLVIRTADRLADGVPAVERAWLLNALNAAD